MLEKAQKRGENAAKPPDISEFLSPTLAQTSLLCYTIYCAVRKSHTYSIINRNCIGSV
jgi:hypothetical protein